MTVIEDEEDYENDYLMNQQQDKRALVAAATTTTHSSRSTALVRQHHRQQHPRMDLPHAVGDWYHAVRQLAASPELHQVVHCTTKVVGTATALCVHTALLPVTVPVRIAGHATEMAVCVTSAAWQQVATVLSQVLSLQQQQQQQKKVLLTNHHGSHHEQVFDFHEQDDEDWMTLSPPAAPSRSQLSKLLDKQQEDKNPLEMVLGFFDESGKVFNKVKDDIGRTVTQLVMPPEERGEQQEGQHHPNKNHGMNNLLNESPNNNKKEKYVTSAGESSCESDTENDYLNRLRLDYNPPSSPFQSPPFHNTPPTSSTTTSCHPFKPHHNKPSTAAAAAESRLLLRVDDLDMQTPATTAANAGKEQEHSKKNNNNNKLFFIDLTGKAPSDSDLFARALDQLAEQGLSFFASHPPVRLAKSYQQHHHHQQHHHSISWKPESSTGKLLKKLSKLSTLERLHALEQDVLIWSGKLPQHDPNAPRPGVPFFLARGILQCSPRDFLHLLWDNTRTTEYNNYCLGRTDVVSLDGSQVLACNASTGTKIIQSETRIPFTGMSVFMNCLMHVRPLEPPDEGFVIISRSLATGAAGHHSCLQDNNAAAAAAATIHPQVNPKNEILWGVNVIRRVPHHEHLTDLTSLSQVGSNMVPQFMAYKIGIMGIEDFFKNVRSPKTTTTNKQKSNTTATTSASATVVHDNKQQQQQQQETVRA